MDSVLRLTKSAIKNRWKHSLGVGFSIAISTLLLTSSLSLLTGTGDLFDNMFERQRASHLLLFFDVEDHQSAELADWFTSQPEVKSVSAPTPVYTTSGPLIFQGQEIDKMMQLTEWRRGNLKQDVLSVLKGKKQQGPAPGEIWLPQHFANTFGIAVGDTLDIPVNGGLYSLAVSATIVDPHYSSGMINPNRAWIAPGELAFMFPITDLGELMLGVRLKDPQTTQTVWSRFSNHIRFNGRHFDYEFYKGAFLIFYRFVGTVLLVFSILGILTSAFLIQASLSGAIRQDFAVIGVLKAMGFTPGQIRASFILHYLLLSLVFIPLALLGAYPAVNAMLSSLIQSIGSVGFQFSMAAPALIASVTVLTITVLLSWILSNKAAHIPSVEAIRYGAMAKKEAGGRSLQFCLPDQAPPALHLAIRFLISTPGRSLATFGTLILTVFLLVFAANLTHSFTNIKENKPMWGFDDSDIQVSLNQKILLPIRYQTFYELLSQEKEIEGIFPYGYISAKILAERSKVEEELYGKAFAGVLDRSGLINLEGRHPAAEGEISLCSGTAHTFQKKPGDRIELFLEGTRRTFTVTGIYQDVSNMGKGFRLHASAMQDLNPLWEPDWFGIRLAKGIAAPAFKDRLQRTYGEAVNIELSIDEQIETMGIIDSIKVGMSLFAGFFLLVLFLAVFTDIAHFIRNRRKDLGIFKTVGYTPAILRAAFSYRIATLSVLALLLGLPIALWLIPAFLGQITAGMGLVVFPFSVSILATLAIIPLVITLSTAGAWMASWKLKAVAPRALMEHL